MVMEEEDGKEIVVLVVVITNDKENDAVVRLNVMIREGSIATRCSRGSPDQITWPNGSITLRCWPNAAIPIR